jgi:TetR/AcrR family transcriptional repressor of nem operon
MPYSSEHKAETRQKILASAARLFNRSGFVEVTIGEIMTGAGLTHGGFYRHLNSKDELYCEVIAQFLCRPPEPWQRKPAQRCAPGQPFAFYVVDAYLSREHLDDVEGSCPLIGLPSDAARSGKGVKSAYRQVAESMIRLFESNLSGPDAHEQALVFVSLCVGGMVLARGIDNDTLGSELRDAAQSHILKMAGWKNGRKQKSLEATK